MRAVLLLGACAAVVLAVPSGGAAGYGRADGSPPFTLEDALAFGEYRLFYGGNRVEGHALRAVLRRSDAAEFVSFVYGDCTPSDDLGCAPPIEIQVWPSCRRHLALYGSPAAPAHERVSVRGVPGLVLDGGTRLELQTGRSTVVVFADSLGRVARIGRALRPVGTDSIVDPLPSPVPGALEGALTC